MRALREAVVVVDLEGRALQVNAAAQYLFGLDLVEWSGRPWLEASRVSSFVRPGAETSGDAFVRLALGGQVVEELDVVVTIGSRSLSLVATANPLRDHQGRLFGTMIVFRRATSEERAEQQLQSTVRLYQLLARHMPDTSFLLVDQQQRCLLAEGASLYATSERERDLAPATESYLEDRKTLREAYAKALAGQTMQVEREAHGRWFSTQFVPVRDEGGQVLAALAVDTEVTKAHERQAERERILAQVAHADRFASLNTLASGMAHELNNPLAVAILNLDLLKHLLPAGESVAMDRARNVVDEVYTATFRVADIVHRMQMLGSAAQGTLERVDANELLKAALELADSKVERCAVRLRTSALPPVIANRGRLIEAFRELLKNAVQSMDDLPIAEREIVVTTRVASATFVEIDIADRGCGVPDEARHHIFEPYFTTREVGQGTGLGLPLVRSVVAGRGGTLELLPKGERGSTFRVRLPTAR